jgi:hypothetical protein
MAFAGGRCVGARPVSARETWSFDLFLAEVRDRAEMKTIYFSTSMEKSCGAAPQMET